MADDKVIGNMGLGIADVDYAGASTDTASVMVDNDARAISVDVTKLPHSLVFYLDGQKTEFDGSEHAEISLTEVFAKIRQERQRAEAKEVELEASSASKIAIDQDAETGMTSFKLLNAADEVISEESVLISGGGGLESAVLDYAGKKLTFVNKDGSEVECDLSGMLDDIDGRFASQASALETAINDFDRDLDAESARATAAEAALGKSISDQADTISAEMTRATQAEAALQTALDSHKSAQNPHGITAAAIGLGNVDNTSDLDKPLSSAANEAISAVDAKVEAHSSRSDNPHGVTKAQIGLGNADNTSDLDKPVSTATQAALDAKADKSDTYLKSEVYSKSETYSKSEVYTQAQVNELIGSVGSLEVRVVSELPETGETGVIYLVPNAGEKPDIYDEYLWLSSDEEFEKIGSTDIDLSNYPTKQEMTAAIAASLLSYYTKAELDAMLAGKADASSVYTKAEVNGLLADKADASSVYTKTETDALLASKADASSVYAKAETDAKLAGKVDKETGKGLSANDFTDAYKDDVVANTAARHSHSNKAALDALTSADVSKLSGVEAGAQVNVLEGVQVNGVDLAITGKKVNVDLSAYENAIETVKVDGTALPITSKSVNITLSGKVDKEAGKGLSSNDFTNAYKDSVDANTSARHTHSNKSVLDDITASYTTAEKTKLANIEAGAQVNVVLSVAGKTGAVALSTSDLTLDNVYSKTEIDAMVGDVESLLTALNSGGGI